MRDLRVASRADFWRSDEALNAGEHLSVLRYLHEFGVREGGDSRRVQVRFEVGFQKIGEQQIVGVNENDERTMRVVKPALKRRHLALVLRVTLETKLAGSLVTLDKAWMTAMESSVEASSTTTHSNGGPLAGNRAEARLEVARVVVIRDDYADQGRLDPNRIEHVAH